MTPYRPLLALHNLIKGTEHENASLQHIANKPDGAVNLLNTSNTSTPLITAERALVTVDMWDHTQRADYHNPRPDFVKTFLDSVADWGYAEKNFG